MIVGRPAAHYLQHQLLFLLQTRTWTRLLIKGQQECSGGQEQRKEKCLQQGSVLEAGGRVAVVLSATRDVCVASLELRLA